MLKAHGKNGYQFLHIPIDDVLNYELNVKEVAENDLGNEYCVLLFHNVLGRGRMHA